MARTTIPKPRFRTPGLVVLGIVAATTVSTSVATAEEEVGLSRERVLVGDRWETRFTTVAPGAIAYERPTGVLRGSAIDDLWIDTLHSDAIAERVAITGDGVSGIVGWWLNNQRTALYTIEDDAIPEWTHAMPDAGFQIEVGADDDGGLLTSVAREENLHVFTAASGTPVDEDVITLPQTGRYTDVSADGSVYGLTTFDDGTDARVRVFQGDGTLLFEDGLDAAPQGMDVSADGSVIAANARAYVKVWESSGALRDSVNIPGETQATAVVSGDGTYLATGGFQRTLRLFEWSGSSYDLLWQSPVSATTWIVSLAIADDGSRVAVGTWTNPSGGKVVVWDTSSMAPLFTDDTYGDYVPGLDMTPDGERLIAGSWGALGATVGAIVSVYDLPDPSPASIPDDFMAGVGSVQSVAISDDGSLAIAGGKGVHARELGSGGFVMGLRITDEVSVIDAGAATSLGLRAAPNPFRASVVLSADRGTTPLGVFGADGRLLRRLDAGADVTWDGRDTRGVRVPAGVYFVGAADGTGDAVRVVRLP